MTRHELLRERWKKTPVRFAPENYGKGYPVPTNEGWTWRDWPETTDIGPFVLASAKEMLAADPLACPLDVIDFGTVLRRKYVLETLHLPTDPESLHVARVVEMLKASELGRFLNSNEAMEAIAAFCLKMEKVKDFKELPEEEKLDFVSLLEKMETEKETENESGNQCTQIS